MLILMISMGYAVPKTINKMIKKDVEKDVNSQKMNDVSHNEQYSKPSHMEDFIKHLKK
jgi:hypothetical protein